MDISDGSKIKKGNKTMTDAFENRHQKVINHLKEHGSITSWEAIQLYRATRLSSIIFNLRKHYIIESEYETYTNELGQTSRYVRYILKGELQ